MADTYSVVMTGKIAEGKSLEQVRGNVAKLFKLEDAQLDKLFSGKPVAVRRGIDRAQADKIRTALTRAGAVAGVKADRPLAATRTSPPKQKKSAPAAASAPVEEPAASPAEQPAEEKTAAQPEGDMERLQCPRCGHEQPFATACELCKMDLTLHIQRVKRRQRVLEMRRQAAR